MKRFLAELRATARDERGRTFVFVPYDQLSDAIGPLRDLPPERAGVLLVEDPAKAARRPYHKQKLALVLANMRHFALEQARRGVAVRYVVADAGYAGAVTRAAAEVGPLLCMEPAERELRVDLAPGVASGALRFVPHDGWLTTHDDFLQATGGRPPYRMESFYRFVRSRIGLLVHDGQPEGGRWSFDTDNRLPFRGEPPAPTPPSFTPDPITEEVCALILRRYADHPGHLDPSALPSTRADAEALWAWGKDAALPHFGPFEDAMSCASTNLFHTRLAPLLHLHRLLPARIVHEAAALPIPIASKEVFVRQILGWREFARHVHRETDGFRILPDLPEGMARGLSDPNAPALPDMLGATEPLPACFWEGGPRSGLACLDRVLNDVWREGYSHHITRLMILSNIGTLLGLSPRALTDWFWIAYTDAYDWVVESNVLGMGTFAAGDIMTTKPYVSGAAYVDRMSDYCDGCPFDPKKTCPLTALYWDFLARNEPILQKNPCMLVPLQALARRPSPRREADARVREAVLSTLARGEPLTPEILPPPQ